MARAGELERRPPRVRHRRRVDRQRAGGQLRRDRIGGRAAEQEPLPERRSQRPRVLGLLLGLDPLGEHRGAGALGLRAVAVKAPSPSPCTRRWNAWWQPGALRRAADLLDQHPRLALIQARILVGPDERDDPTCTEMAASPLPAADGQPGHALLSFVACAVVVRRDAFLAVGGFHERLAVGGEEELAGWDLAAAGWQMSYVPEVIAHHHPPRSSRRRPRRREIQIRNALWTSGLRRPRDVAAIDTVRCLRRLPRERAIARGICRALAGVPWIVRARRVNPPHVEAMLRLLDDRRAQA
jgi:N-acetylglucosaminyl-diphospho-decaprenol L-rhamnosyltransferase